MAGLRPWGQLERLLERLPPHSHYRAALDADDSYGELVVALYGEPADKPTSVPLVGYDPHAARLDNLFDAINALTETVVAALSKKGSRQQPTRAPRPETAAQRIRRKRKREKLFELEDKLTPGRG